LVRDLGQARLRATEQHLPDRLADPLRADGDRRVDLLLLLWVSFATGLNFAIWFLER
jgi:hypothetical protein